MRLRRAPLLGVTGELNTSWAEGELGNGKTEKQNGTKRCTTGQVTIRYLTLGTNHYISDRGLGNYRKKNIPSQEKSKNLKIQSHQTQQKKSLSKAKKKTGKNKIRARKIYHHHPPPEKWFIPYTT